MDDKEFIFRGNEYVSPVDFSGLNDRIERVPGRIRIGPALDYDQGEYTIREQDHSPTMILGIYVREIKRVAVQPTTEESRKQMNLEEAANLASQNYPRRRQNW